MTYYLRMHAGNEEIRLPDDQVSLVVEVFRMLADATRVQVLWSLADREMSVNELAEHVGKPAPSVSQHLAVDAVHNAEHSGPGVPRHHRVDDGLRVVGQPASGGSARKPTRKRG